MFITKKRHLQGVLDVEEYYDDAAAHRQEGKEDGSK